MHTKEPAQFAATTSEIVCGHCMTPIKDMKIPADLEIVPTAFVAKVREFLQSFDGSRPQDVIGQDSHALYHELAAMLPEETAS